MSNDTMIPRDIYARITTKDGVSYVGEFRVWDAERFLARLQEQHAKEGNTVVPATRQDYLKQREATA